MNICFLIYNISRPGGSERVTSLIANGLKNLGHNVFILSICGDNKSFYELDSNIVLNTIYKGKEKVNHKLFFLSIIKKIYRFYKENNIQVSIDVFASLSIFSIPVKKLLKIKNITWEHFNFYSNEGLNKIARKLSCKFSDSIITLTEQDMIAYKDNIKIINAKLDYIYNPTPFEVCEKSKLDTLNILTVGRLTYQKGYDILLDVWKEVEEKNKNLKLHIVGSGEEKDNLLEKCNLLGLKNVFFEGITNNIEEFYKDAILYVSTSRFEGLPMCMIEAQSFGLPIISFEYRNGPKEIIQDGKTGYIIQDYNTEKMANKIVELANDKVKLHEFSNKINIDKFKFKKIIEKWNIIINDLR